MEKKLNKIEIHGKESDVCELGELFFRNQSPN